MNTNIKELPWFDEQWAQTTSNLTKDLVRSYMMAYDAGYSMLYPFGIVRLSGVWEGRKLLTFRAFVRDAIVRHIQMHLRMMNILADREFILSHPLKSETSPGVKATASDEVRESAMHKVKEFETKRQAVHAHIKESMVHIKSLEELVSKHKNVTNPIIKSLVSIVRRISPAGVLAWFTLQFSRLPELPLSHAVALCVVWIIGYNLLGVLGLPFHDSDYRKHHLFEGYMGKSSDGVRPLEPPVSRIEKAFYDHLKIKQPVIISWDVLIPVFHYCITIVMVILSIVFLPLDPEGRAYAIGVGSVIILLQLRNIRVWRKLIRLRYETLGIWKLITASLI